MSQRDLLGKVDSLLERVSPILGVETVSSDLEDDEPVLVIFVDKGLVVEGELPIEHEGMKVVVRESGGDATAQTTMSIEDAKDKLKKMLQDVPFVNQCEIEGADSLLVYVDPSVTDEQFELIPREVVGWPVSVERVKLTTETQGQGEREENES